jgi:hypothetical protein
VRVRLRYYGGSAGVPPFARTREMDCPKVGDPVLCDFATGQPMLRAAAVQLTPNLVDWDAYVRLESL